MVDDKLQNSAQFTQKDIAEATWDGRNQFGIAAATGVYFYRIEAGSFIQTKRMILVK